MIIGRGNIGSVIKDRDDLLFFASGVSDSRCEDEAQFKRERDLLISMDTDSHIVYFSSLGVFRWTNAYIEHKKKMEEFIKSTFKYYTIVRVEVISWGRNKNTIHNYFRRMINEGNPVTIYDTHRYIVDEGEFNYWLSCIKYGDRNEMNITGKKYHICDIYKMVKENKL